MAADVHVHMDTFVAVVYRKSSCVCLGFLSLVDICWVLSSMCLRLSQIEALDGLNVGAHAQNRIMIEYKDVYKIWIWKIYEEKCANWFSAIYLYCANL